MRLYKNARGQAVIEAALVLILVFAILFAAADFGKIFMRAQRMSTISREAALQGFHDCRPDVIMQITGYTPAMCLAGIQDTSLTIGNYLIPNFSSNGDIILSMYGFDEDGQFTQLGTAGGSGTHATRFDAAKVPTDIGSYIVISEVFYDNTDLTAIEQLLSIALDKLKNLYQATII